MGKIRDGGGKRSRGVLVPSISPVTYQSQVFKDETLFFSRDGIPNLATVIPAMDCIEKVLTTNAIDKQLSPSIRAALAIGKWTLNRYYSKTGLSQVYRIAMGV